jgi:hypothetical protein
LRAVLGGEHLRQADQSGLGCGVGSHARHAGSVADEARGEDQRTAALLGLGMAGWSLSAGFWRWILAIGLPIVAAVLWGTFAVPDDPSRSGRAPVPVPGAVRLALELVILFGGATGFYLTGHAAIGIVMALLIAFNYAFSLDRLGWLLRQ